MSETHGFTGFPEAGLQFLDDLAVNNNRDWFEANKQIYHTALQEPAVAFIAAFGERLKEISSGILYDIRLNGGGSLTRIHRDIRFSKDKTPYNTHLNMLFWEGSGKRLDNPYFGLRIEAGQGGGLLGGMYVLTKSLLAAYREAVADAVLGPELVEAIEAVNQAGDYTLGHLHYKRVPAGYPADHPRADLLRYDGLYAIYDGIDRVTLTRPELIDVCFEHSRKMAPLFRWLVKVNNQSPELG